ncbi:hypothetical protein Y032_0039g43 [Ancylostoma ceylanicum]|uniref:Secreted protein n=1 Tax=Ancylostoma ceylanicum TaxID=53326 RepID=A0A016UJZ0_9BILA|nr:hypothetical protein Y032_0039g43 [Ancylostoma ceylanicum]
MLWTRGGTAAPALWLSAALLEAAGNHDVSVFLRVSAQQAPQTLEPAERHANTAFRPSGAPKFLGVV